MGVARLWRPADARSQLLHGYPRRIVNPEDMRAYAAGEQACNVSQLQAAEQLAGSVSVPVGQGGTLTAFGRNPTRRFECDSTLGKPKAVGA